MRGDGYCKATLFMVVLLAGEWECNTILATLMSPSPLHPTSISRAAFFFKLHDSSNCARDFLYLRWYKISWMVLLSSVRYGQFWESW